MHYMGEMQLRKMWSMLQVLIIPEKGKQFIPINNFRILRKFSHFWFIKWMCLGTVPNDELVIENTIADLNKAKLVLLKYW